MNLEKMEAAFTLVRNLLKFQLDVDLGDVVKKENGLEMKYATQSILIVRDPEELYALSGQIRPVLV